MSGSEEPPDPTVASDPEHPSDPTVASDPEHPSDPTVASDPEEQLVVYARALVDGIREALPGWVVAAVGHRLPDAPSEVWVEAEAAGKAAAARVGDEIAALLLTDIDSQRENPLSVLRRAVSYPTEVLRRAGVAPMDRDDFVAARFPDDVYDLAPASFADIHPDLQQLGLSWGAAKAFVHRRRHLGR